MDPPIRDGKKLDPGLKKFGYGINIPDPQHWKNVHFICAMRNYSQLALCIVAKFLGKNSRSPSVPPYSDTPPLPRVGLRGEGGGKDERTERARETNVRRMF